MTLRTRLLLAELPLVVALVAVAVLALLNLGRLGDRAGVILQDNYRSVLATQRMKEALERMDSGALFIVGGRREEGLIQAAENRKRFEAELLVQEANITEAGEAEATRRLRAQWTGYERAFDAFLASSQPARAYFEGVAPAFLEAKRQADAVLDLNHDAMLRKSDDARRTADRVKRLMVLGALAALVLGVYVSGQLTRRTLRPVGVLSQAVRRLGEGDLEARAMISGADEIARLAQDFNAMAERLAQYRRSSLGELLQAQQASQAAIDSLPDPVVVFGANGEVLNVNAAATALGLPRDLGVGDPLARARPEARALIERVRTHVLSGKGPFVPRGFEEALRLELPEGERAYLPRGTTVVGEDGAISGATVILQDVTRLRRFDELKNDLVATVAHEFRTPLTSLSMAIHLCLEERAGPVTEKQADLLSAARADCSRLQGIVDDLLDLSRLQAGRVSVELAPHSAPLLVDAAIAEHQAEAETANVRLVAEPIEPVDVLADRERVALVFSNLIRNALRHARTAGTVLLRGKVEGPAVRFEVQDDGLGIAPEHQPRVFDRFFQVPGGDHSGAGLGLSIAKEIVLAHHGEIGVESRPGEGSTFWFTLPRGE